jgi:sulfur carrier protein
MNIKLNGENKSIDSVISLNDFVLSQLNGKEPKGIAVAVNETIIPKQQWSSVVINENDSIEIVHAVQGG